MSFLPLMYEPLVVSPFLYCSARDRCYLYKINEGVQMSSGLKLDRADTVYAEKGP